MAKSRRLRKPSKPPAAPHTVKPVLPTQETMQHSEYEVKQVALNTKAAVNLGATPCLRAFNRRALSGRQLAAAVAFEDTYSRQDLGRATWSRDSLDMAVRGGVEHETDRRAQRIISARMRLDSLQKLIGSYKFSALVSVCVYHEPFGAWSGPRFDAIVDGLNAVADSWGLGVE